MIAHSWIVESIGERKVQRAAEESGRRRLQKALGIRLAPNVSDEQLRFVADGLELRVFDLLESDDHNALRTAASEAFQVARSVPPPKEAIAAGEWLVRLGCVGVIGDRSADVGRLLKEYGLPDLPIGDADWGKRVWSSILDVWLRLLRKQGWADLDELHRRVVTLRRDQREYEPDYLTRAEERRDTRPAWELMAEYHLAKAAEILATYLAQGSVEKRYDIRQQLEAQFDRAISAAGQSQTMELESLTRLLARTSAVLVDNSIWTVTRAVNSRVTKFVESLTDPQREGPMVLEMLPPQRHSLREEGLLGSSHRSVVISLPTSSGKTIIAQFRILQAINQFDSERGWVAYLAPTRALVNQMAVRLRRDFTNLNVPVEKVSPALEVDGLEMGLLLERDPKTHFRVLVTTPEKLDLMLRAGWEEKIGRPLTLVVVDEAHGLASEKRGLKLELLLATINRECRFAQFLLMTPFIRNAAEIARWLSSDSNKNIELGLDWSPNDRVIAIAEPVKGSKKGDFTIRLTTRHTSRHTIALPETINLGRPRPLGMSWSTASHSTGKLAAAIAQHLHQRGTVIVLVDKPTNSWGVAAAFKVRENFTGSQGADIGHIKHFLTTEMGPDFPLAELLDYGVAVHHAGMPDDVRTLVEWLTEKGKLNALVATTTIAQGVNFPVSGVVFASHQYPWGQNMPPEDFWNIAGRAGRVDQEDLGIVALAAPDTDKARKLEEFVDRNVGELNSTLIKLVKSAANEGKLLQLETLAWQPGWSAFLQYLAHTYRQIGNHELFAQQVEEVLRGTLGFQALRQTHKGWADSLVRGVYNYAERIKGRPLKLVDLTGFSWESVSNTLVRISEAQLKPDMWSNELFGRRRADLRRMMGVLLQVPELRDQLKEVTGGPTPDGDTLSRIICDWVQGRSLPDMAAEYFSKEDQEDESQAVGAMTRCCQSVFGRLTQTASWGLAALQSLTLGDALDRLSVEEQRELRNLPARVYYGVNSDEAVALRLLSVPRTAAQPLAKQLNVKVEESLSGLRGRLREAEPEKWQQALGKSGESYRRVWTIIEGEPYTEFSPLRAV